ncbi:MAG: hypothetical protein Q9170_005671 [Blastenia crenularia]
MAPKRKNKKLATNPARGFATTSTASKTKPPDEVVIETTKLESASDKQYHAQIEISSVVHEEKELHELSPEELEKQLEESNLNLFLESHNEKIKREVSRQTSRLQTEKRVLRAQAEPLQTRSWLPSELMELIAGAIKLEDSDEHHSDQPRDSYAYGLLSDDDLCIKIWTLKQVLAQLGFAYELCQQALRYLLGATETSRFKDSVSVKDSLWGLNCCLDWLALHCEAEQLPSYLPIRAKAMPTLLLDQPSSDAKFEISDSEPMSTGPTASRSSSPSSHTIEHGLDAAEPAKFTSTPPSSDADSDMDPDTMTERFIGLQTRLYELDPDFDVAGHQNGRKAPLSSKTTPDQNLPSQRVKILRRLERLQRDILFDRYDAEQRWTEKRNQLAKSAAQRKRLQIDNGSTANDIAPLRHGDGAAAIRQAQQSSDDSEGDDTAEALGDFFSGLSDDPTTKDCSISSPDIQASSGHPIIVRDFGKWGGISPRRTLEDACKARDTRARISYRLMDRSPFSKQHAVRIHWSRDQPQPLESPTKALSCTSDRRHVHVEMITDATPDSIQSEAYVSTAALFLIFSSIPKEEKASLRLPSVWRDFWVELCGLKKEVDLAADREELRSIRALVEARPKPHDEGPKEPPDVSLKTPAPNIDNLVNRDEPAQVSKLSEHLKALWLSKSAVPSFHSMLRQRKTLPIWSFRDTILQTIKDHQIIIICGETGCGKSTQVPSFILEGELSLGRACRIYCTEPRRISAISLARRVSEELGERKIDVGTSRSLVGYAIRMENKLVRETRLVYATTGIVMRMLESADNLQEITHLVLDEVHERSIESDFLLIVLRKLLVKRPKLRVILMSATVDAAKFSDYFNGAPVMTVPGRTFPVESRYLEDVLEETKFTGNDFQSKPSPDEIDEDEDIDAEDSKKAQNDTLIGYSTRTRSTLANFDEYRINYDLILNLLEAIASKPKLVGFSKAILVFLPGIAEIRRLNGMLSGHSSFSYGWQIHALHSTIAMDEQERAFATPPANHRKIVLSTNIAETGVTIPDVTCVIDTGKHKEMRFDERRQLSRLIEVFISRANAKQRRGRAGRVQQGICFHLFTRGRHDSIMALEQTPEMLRLSLQDLVLRVKLCKLGSIDQTLSEALDPPSAKNIRRAIDALVDVKALTVAEELTPLGRQLAKLPLDVFLGKLILLGCIFKCLDATLTIAAILSSKSPFAAPMGARSQADQARLAFRRGDSDPLTVHNAYCSWRRACNASGASEQQFCRKNCLSQQNLMTIEELKAQLATSLVDAGFLELGEGEEISLHRIRSWSSKRTFLDIPARYNSHSTDLMVNSILCWSFYPKLLKRDGKGWRNVANNQSISLHPTSVNKGIEHPPQWLSFYHIMQSTNKYYNAHETSAVEPFAFILACGDAEFKMFSGVIVIDGNRIRLSVDDWKLMLVIKRLRHELRQIAAQLYRDPRHRLLPQQQKWLSIWEKIFAYHDEKVSNAKKKGIS